MKTVLVFSGFNMRAVYAFLRTLEEKSISYAIIASSENDDIFMTDYKDKVLTIRQQSQLVLEDLITSIAKVQSMIESDKYLIAPSTEALNRFLLDYRNVFENMNCIVPLVNKKLYKKVSDKKSFGELCKKHLITTPREYTIENIVIPCVAKPKTYVGDISKKILKPVIIKTEDELKQFLHNNNSQDFYFQEYLNGRSLYLLYYIFREGDVMKYSQENFIQQNDGGSILAAKSSMLHLESISKDYESLFKSIGFTGLIMIELKMNSNDIYMIEANPRFWGPSQLFVDAGINFFEAMLFEYGLLSTKPVSKPKKSQQAVYYWNDGYSFSKIHLDKTMFHNYSKEQYLDEIKQWNEADLLNRADTSKIYNNLLQGQNI